MVAAMQATLQGRSARCAWLCVAGALVLAGCASAPPKPGASVPGHGAGVAAQSGRDGAEPRPPTDLDRVPDAQPQVEPVRASGPNKPYEALGREYVPFIEDRPFSERGLASWYGHKFQGRRTASGEPYDMYAMTAAHPTLPIPSYARVRNPANGREIVVRVNDRGPFHPGRVIDLSYTAALKLDLLRGMAPVEVERITFDEIRAGGWRRGGPAQAVQLAARDVPEPSPAGDSSPMTSVPMPVVASIVVPPVASNVLRAARAEGPAFAAGPDAQAGALPARGFWIQLGAFRQRDGAAAFQRRVAEELDWLSPLLAVFSDAALFRLQAGPYPSRDEARGAAESIRAALQLVPVIVERR
jgi:rare lipoprotein A